MNNLLELARSARDNSYSPYSHFSVGAAVEMISGQIYVGSNIENSSYGLSICAERVAIFKAVSAGETVIKKIAVTCQGNDGPLSSLMPCGACRQVISEFANKETIVHVDGVGEFSLKELLPSPFSL